MRLICPGCGATASIEAWNNDAEARSTLAAIVKLPAPVPAHVLPYLSLFRPEARALSWKKALKLVTELAALVGSGYVQVDKQAARKCPPAIWALAMDDMVVRFAGKRPHFRNHNYLRDVAYDKADQADAGQERRTREAEQAGNIRAVRQGEPEAPCSTEVARENLKKIKAMLGGLNNAE